MTSDKPDGPSLSWPIRYQPVCVSVLCAVVYLLLSPSHRVFDEWTGVMELFSGRELVSGAGYHGWASGFYPPLFSLVYGVGSLFGDGFVAGKVISVLSASLLLWVAFRLAGELGMDKAIRLLAQLFLALSPLFFQEALQADNHMFEALLFNSGLLLFLRGTKTPLPSRLFWAGVVCGLAGLTRYTSYVLILLPFSLFVFRDLNRRAVLAGSFLIGFVLVSTPWWAYNGWYNGSGFYNLNYLNVWTGIVGRDTNSLHVIWRSLANQSVTGLGDILRHHTKAYAHHVFGNLFQCADLLIGSAGALALLVVPGILDSLLRLNPKQSLVVFGVLGASVFAVAQAYINPYYLLQWTPLMVVVSVAFLTSYLRSLEERFGDFRAWHGGRLVIGGVLAFGLLLCWRPLKAYYAEPAPYHWLSDIDQVTMALQKHDPNLKSKVVMAVDPARAYYAGSRYLETPFEYVGTIDGLVCYRGISPRLRHYAAKYPSGMDEANLKADYLVYTSTDDLHQLHDPPQFDFLMDPASDRIPRNFRLIYRSISTVVYEVDWAQSTAAAHTRGSRAESLVN